MKRIIAVIAFTIVAFGLRAQTVITLNSDVFQSRYFKVTGHVVDSTTNENLSFVSAYLRHTSDTLITNFALSDADGKIELPEVTTGNYVLTVEYLGYKKYQKEFYVRKEVQLGEIRMIPDIKALNAASVSAAGKEVEFKQDTIIFNAGLFKTGSNDNLAALLKRMPGVEISKEGTVTVNGKAVDKITIEGKTFFMNDKSAALNNLPASIVDKIKVIDKDSEEAQISGVRDVEKQRVMDVELKEEYKKGFFGNIKIAGGYAIPGKRDDPFLETDKAAFNNNLLASYYDDNTQLTVVGGAQNVNDGNAGAVVVFSDADDDSAVSLQTDGVHSSWHLGANLNTDKIKKVESSISARYSEDYLDYRGRSDRLTFQKDISDLRNLENVFTTGKSGGMNMNGEFKSMSGKKMSFIFRPKLSYNRVNQDSQSYDESFYGDARENASTNYSGSDDRRISTSGDLQLTAKFASNRKRRLGVNMSYSFMNGEGEAYDNREVYYASGDVLTQNLTYDKTSSGTGFTGGMFYTEPIADNWTFNLMTSSSFSNSNREKTAFEQGGQKNDMFSSYNKTDYTSHMARVRGQYSKNMTTVDFGASAYLTENVINTTSAGVSTQTGKDDWLFNVSPYITASTNKMKDGTVTNCMFSIMGRVSRPSSSNTLASLNIMSPTRLSVGNIYLRPYSSQTVYASVNVSNKKSQSLSVYMFGNIYENQSSNAIWYDSRSIMYTVPVNIKDPSLNSNFQITFNTPLTKNGKLKFHTYLLGGYDSSVSYQSGSTREGFDLDNFSYSDFMSTFWGDASGDLFYSGKSGFQKSRTSSINGNMGMYLHLNLDNFELTASVNPTARKVTYTLDPRANVNIFTMDYTLEALYTTKHGFELGSNVGYYTFKGYRGEFNDPILDWRCSILKNMKAVTIGISVLDILNQARTRSMVMNDNYSEYKFTNTIGRCALLSVKFNFGKMNAAKSSAAQMASFNMLM